MHLISKWKNCIAHAHRCLNQNKQPWFKSHKALGVTIIGSTAIPSGFIKYSKIKS